MTGNHNAIMLIVTGLSERTTCNELKSTFRQLIKSRWPNRWSNQGTIRSCDIIRITNLDTKDVEYHGLVELHPAKLALLAIRELSGTKIGTNSVEIRRYLHHSPAQGLRQYVPEGETENQVAQESGRPNLSIELVEQRSTPLLPSLFGWLASVDRENYPLEEAERHST